LADPRHLDRGDAVSDYSRNVCLAEEASACWLDDERIAVAASDEPEDPAESREAGTSVRLRQRGLAIYDLATHTCFRAFQLREPAGTILAVGTRHVLSLYRHPKLIDLSTGEVLHTWTELCSGRQDGSIVWGLKDDAKPPPMAFDPAGKRFAITNGDTLTVIEFNHSSINSYW